MAFKKFWSTALVSHSAHLKAEEGCLFVHFLNKCLIPDAGLRLSKRKMLVLISRLLQLSGHKMMCCQYHGCKLESTGQGRPFFLKKVNFEDTVLTALRDLQDLQARITSESNRQNQIRAQIKFIERFLQAYQENADFHNGTFASSVHTDSSSPMFSFNRIVSPFCTWHSWICIWCSMRILSHSLFNATFLAISLTM